MEDEDKMYVCTVNTKIQIEVMKSFLEGKTIESFDTEGDRQWHEESFPLWDWKRFDYRAKEIGKPYKNGYELVEDLLKRGIIRPKANNPYKLYSSAFHEGWCRYEYADGAPFGIVEEE